MKKLLCAVILTLTAAVPLAAQTFGELFPVTNTRYGIAYGVPHLTTNGDDFFLFWAGGRAVRATRLIDNEPRSGHVVLNVSGGFDVAWTGQRFLVAATDDFEQKVIGCFLDKNARPVSAEQTVIAHGAMPRLAAGPERILVLFSDAAGNVRSVTLSAEGESIGAVSRIIAPSATRYAVAASENGFVAIIGSTSSIRAIAFDRQGNVIGDRTLTHGEPYYREVTVASDGSKYVAVWSEEQAVVAATIDADANIGAPLVIDTEIRLPGRPTVIWNGASWTVTYDGKRQDDEHARIVQLDFAAQRVLSREQTAEGLGLPTVAALDGRVLAAWTAVSLTPGGMFVSDLPLAAHQPRNATFGATHQSARVATASANGTLIVWDEAGNGRISLRAGFRTHDGRWSERELDPDAGYVSQVVAASDGKEFLVLQPITNGTRLIHLNEDGQPLSSSSVPLIGTAVTWTGSHYAILDPVNRKGVLVNRNGTVQSIVNLPDLPYTLDTIASDGLGHLLLISYLNNCPFELCYATGIYATRLDGTFQRIGADLELAPEDTSDFMQISGVVWNGSEYAVVWSEQSHDRVAYVPATSGPIEIQTIHAPLRPQSIAALTTGSIAIVGRGLDRNTLTTTLRVSVLRRDGAVATTSDIESWERVASLPQLVTLPNGGVAYVCASVQSAAPHHGTSHVMMAIAQLSIPQPPGAPYVRAKLTDKRIEVDWAPPAGPFSGYRLEYRVDDGSWNELEQWFPAFATHTSITRPAFGTNFAIRMRAFNDGGAGAYSTPSITTPTRRRAVR